MRLNIQEIAKIAGVSKSTVSKVINGQQGVGAERRQQILQLIETLGFYPDASARALAQNRRGILGLLIPHASDTVLGGYFWNSLLASVSRYAAEKGFAVRILTPDREGDIQGVLDPVLKSHNLDGLVIGADLVDKITLSSLIVEKIPFVLFGQNPEFSHYCVDVDNIGGATVLVQHMVSQGCRKIAAFTGPRNYPSVGERLLGYHQALDQAGIAWKADAFSPYSSALVKAELKSLVQAHPDLDGLFLAAGGEFLFDCLEVLSTLDVDYHHLTLTVFDDYPFLNFITPRISAIRQPFMEAGKACVRMLLALVEGQSLDQDRVFLSPQLILR